MISLEPEFFIYSHPSSTGGNTISNELRTISERLKRNSMTRRSEETKCSSKIVYSMPIESNDVSNLSDISDFELE